MLIALGIFALMYVTWFFFLAVMSMLAAKRAGVLKPGTVTYILCLPIALVGVSLDFLVNMTIGTVLFLEIPQEWLLTIRMDRLMTYGNPWRANLATWLCKNLLDPFQSGGHCHKIGPGT